MATIHQFDNNPEEDEFYLVEIYWFITYTLVEPSINQQFKKILLLQSCKIFCTYIPTFFLALATFLRKNIVVGTEEKSVDSKLKILT